MTTEEFCTALAACAARITWYPQTPRGAYALRGTVCGERVCPLTAVAYAVTGTLWPTTNIRSAARALRLAPRDCAALTQAADASYPEATALRARLWACVGLPLEED